MSNPSLFFAIAGISMSFAGFAGLFLALRPHGTEWQGYEIGQINAIILYALTTLFGAMLVVPIASLIGESAGLRVMSAAILVPAFYGHQVRVGTSWLRWSQLRSDVSRRELFVEIAPFALVAIAEQTLLLVNFLVPTQELYELALILMLGTPALVFAWVVTHLESSGSADRAS
jgi:hypothetical protein